MEKKMYNLFLDDVRFPKTTFDYTENPIYINEEWEIVRSYDQFVKFITENGLPYMVSFDHDLAEAHYHESMYMGSKVYMKYLETVSEKTGHDCVKWLVSYCMDNKLEFPLWYLHTMNPVGKENMRSYIVSYLRSLDLPEQPASSCTCDEGGCSCRQ
jgi:hypothetical protein